MLIVFVIQTVCPARGPPMPPPKIDSLPKKNIPQSAQPLKSFNWSKLPDMKVTNTIWSELDETKWYNSMDLESIDKMFSAYQKNEKNGMAVSLLGIYSYEPNLIYA